MAAIEYFYSAHSVFAYLGSARLREIADAAGMRIAHRPMDLHRVMEEVGSSAFRQRGRAHIAYFFGTEIRRWAEERNVAWLGRIPTHHSKDYSLANRFLIAAAAGRDDDGDGIDRLSHALLQGHWRDDADLSDPQTLIRLANDVSLDGAAMLDVADAASTREAYEQNTREAVRRSVFGSPAYFVGGEMFYGQDRLHFVEKALRASGD